MDPYAKYNQCSKCHEFYNTDTFACMNGAGEDTRAYITACDTNYVLCPICASKLYSWLVNKE